MTDATVAANARSLPEATINQDAELISDVGKPTKYASVMMVINQPEKSIFDEELEGDSYENILCRLSDEIKQLREKISGPRSKTMDGVRAKLSAVMVALELDGEDAPLFFGNGSVDKLLHSIHLDMVALNDANTAAIKAMAQTLTPPIETMVSLVDARSRSMPCHGERVAFGGPFFDSSGSPGALGGRGRTRRSKLERLVSHAGKRRHPEDWEKAQGFSMISADARAAGVAPRCGLDRPHSSES